MLYNTIPTNRFSAKGWLWQYLDRQISGITGNIEACGDPFNTKVPLWATKNEPYYWYPYEQQGYWIDGALKCAYIQKNDSLYNKASEVIYQAIDLADEDGYIGPTVLKQLDTDGRLNNYLRWPHAVFFRAIIAEYEATGDKKLLEALVKHFKSSPLFYKGRNLCSIEALGWLFNKTGDEFFKNRALEIYESFQSDPQWTSITEDYILSDKPFDIHGVTICETLKLLCILYDISRQEKFLKLAVCGVDKLINNCLLVDGVISSEEFVRGNTSDMAHETCDIADFAWLLGYMFELTGNTKYLDIIERMTYNAAPSVVIPDFCSIQYFSCPNLVIANETSAHCRYTKGMWTMSYRPYGYAACCIGNVNRIMPNFISKMWHTDKCGNLVCTLYGPSALELEDLKITEQTDYPFNHSLKFKFEAQKETEKTVFFRVPCWAQGFSLLLNGKTPEFICENGFIRLTHAFSGTEELELCFNTKPTLNTSAEGGVYLDYGPLLFAFEVPYESKKFIAKEHDSSYPSYSLTPNGDWNYALRTDLFDPSELILNHHDSEYFWQTAPISFILPAEKIDCYKLTCCTEVDRWMYTEKRALIDDTFVYNKFEGSFTFTPALPSNSDAQKTRSGKVEYIRLVPYGCTKLRLSVFNSIKN